MARTVSGMDINGQAADVTQVFPADRVEGVVLPIKVILIHHQGFHREFVQVEVRSEHLGAATQPVRERIRNEG